MVIEVGSTLLRSCLRYCSVVPRGTSIKNGENLRESIRMHVFFLIQVVPYIESPLFHQGQKAEAFKKKGNERLKDDGWVPQKAVSNDCGYQWHTPYIPILIILNIYIYNLINLDLPMAI